MSSADQDPPSDQNNPPDHDQNRARKGKGRKKTGTTKIEDETKQQTTFSKRRPGVFKKCNELASRCGAEVAALTFSTKNVAYSYGSPSVAEIVNRFLDGRGPNQRAAPVSDVVREFDNIEGRIKLEKSREKDIIDMRKDPQNQDWAPSSIDEMEFEQVLQVMNSMANFKQMIDSKVQNAISGSGGSGATSGYQWNNPSVGPSASFGFNANAHQWPSTSTDPFTLFQNQDPSMWMPNNNAPPVLEHSTGAPGGSSNAPLFLVGGGSAMAPSTFGVGSSNWGNQLNPVVPNVSGTLLPPSNPSFGMNLQYGPGQGGISGAIFPHNYGDPSGVIPHGGAGTGSMDPPQGSGEGSGGFPNVSQGFGGYYGGGGGGGNY